MRCGLKCPKSGRYRRQMGLKLAAYVVLSEARNTFQYQ